MHTKPLPLDQLDEFPSYKGGRTCLYGGYVWEFCPGHRLQNRWGWVAQHRLVAEDTLGRPLQQNPDPKIAEHVHHIDGCPTNNDPANLEVLSKSAHHSYESRKWNLSRNTHLTVENVQAALVGRSIRDAAAFLGVHHQTLRNRFPEVLAPRKRKVPTRIDDPVAIATVLRLAGNPKLGLREVSAITRMSQRTVVRICARNGIPWVRKSREGEVRRTYRGKPTQKMLATRVVRTESADQ